MDHQGCVVPEPLPDSLATAGRPCDPSQAAELDKAATMQIREKRDTDEVDDEALEDLLELDAANAKVAWPTGWDKLRAVEYLNRKQANSLKLGPTSLAVYSKGWVSILL